MKNILDLSFRYKIPLWGGVLIIITALTVSGSLILNAYDELKEDVILNAESMGYSLKNDLFPAILHDDIWRAYEIISERINKAADGSNPISAETILAVDNMQRIIVSSNPKSEPMLTEMRNLSPEYALVGDWINQSGGRGSRDIDIAESKYYYYVTPISSDDAYLGSLIIVHPKDFFYPRFFDTVKHALLIGAMILAILLPFNWYWGRRMALPLVHITERLEKIGRQWPPDLNHDLYGYHDEIGKLFEAYSQMLRDLKIREQLEKQMVQSERLAALGQLTAGIAHEINNPLSGMLTAIDTLKSFHDLGPQTLKTISLIVRGLNQIKDTVSALLVEAKVKSRNLTPQDIEDVLILITPMARKKSLHLGWHNSMNEEIPLPASQVRQILINLLLNAVEAASQHGEVACDIDIADNQLQLSVTNNGKVLSTEQIAHLFEPFSPLSESGHGLGLWVTYQIVNQLGGLINVKQEPNTQMHFTVNIPFGGMT